MANQPMHTQAPSPQQVLITGGAGFIGQRLTKRLLDAGHQVTVLDNLHPQVHGHAGSPVKLDPRAQLVTGDVTTDGLRVALRQCQPNVVFHLAAETGTGQSLTESSRHGRVNVVGTTQLQDALQGQTHLKRVVLTSSRAVYGEGAWRTADGLIAYPRPRSEKNLKSGRFSCIENATPVAHDAATTEPRPISIYGVTKHTQEQLLRVWCEAFSVELAVLRLQNVYGAGQAVGNPYTGVLTTFARLASQGQTLDVYEDGEIVRDFVHVSDVVEALFSAGTAPLSAPALEHPLDIGCGRPETLHQVAIKLAALAKAPAPKVSGRYRLGDVRAASCSIERARLHLGYTPKMSLETGLGELLGFVRSELQGTPN